jgi:heme exporter protein B
MSLWSETRHLLSKELRLEFRNRFALFGLLLYIFMLAFIVFLSFANVDGPTWNALYWITLLFVAVNSVARSFMHESHNRQLYYYVICSAEATILSKILYNGLIMILMAAGNILLFSVLVGWPVEQPGLFLLNALLGAIGLSAAFSLMSAIASKTNSLGIMAVLSIPVFIPMLMLLISASSHALETNPEWAEAWRSVGAVGALDAITIALALILFPYLWRD